MKNLFAMDGPLFRILSLFYDLIILNLLTLLCCLPLATVGTAVTAMHHVLLQLVREEAVHPVRTYFRSFRENLRQTLCVWMAMLPVLGGCAWGYLSIRTQPEARPVILALGLAVVVLFLLSLYLFPFIAHFHNTIPASIRFSAALAVACFPRTAGMVLIWAIFYALLWNFSAWTVPVFLLFGLSLPAYFCALLYHPVFLRLERRQDTEENE